MRTAIKITQPSLISSWSGFTISKQRNGIKLNKTGTLGKTYRGAEKCLARPGNKQITETKLQLLQATQEQFRRLSLQPGLRGSNDLRVGRKVATFQLFLESGRAKDLSAPK